MTNILCGRRDRVSSGIHFLGAALGIAGLVVLVVLSAMYATPWHVVSYAIYGASLVLLYTASSCYHLFYISERFHAVMRKIDHMMIFVLIAGTYTPICLVTLRGPWGWALLGTLWSVTLAGILFKVFWMNAPRWLYTSIYLAMGWTALVAIHPLVRMMTAQGLAWMLAGGICYSAGGVFYAMKRPRWKNAWFGFHELFHVLILAGSVCHFLMMLEIL